MTHCFFTPILRCLITLTAPLHRVAVPLSTLAMAVVIAGALAAVGPAAVTDHTSSLSAQQCYDCDKGECEKNGPGGTECNTHHDPDGNVQCVPGGTRCRCYKIERRFWPDGQKCVPILADNGTATSEANDVRYASLEGIRIRLHRVGSRHFAAMSCQDADDWVVLGRESATGEIEVTTNPVLIGLRRWVFHLGKQPTVATNQIQE